MISFQTPRVGNDPRALCRALLRVFLVAALAVAFFHRLAEAQTVSEAPAGPRPAPLPIEVGSTWTYVGEVWWIPRYRGDIYREHVTWTSEVTAVKRRRGWTAAMLEGHPHDLLVARPDGRAPGTYVLLLRYRKSAGPRVFLVEGPRAWEVWRRVEDRKDKLDGPAHPDEFLLELPLRSGRPVCPPAPGGEPFPCWSVVKEGPADLRTVRGGEKVPHPVLYRVSRWGSSRHAVWTFVPGLGFTSFAAGQGGDVSAVELELVEYHSPSAIGDTALEH